MELAIRVAELVTWLEIVRARDSLVVVVTSVVVLVTLLVIVTGEEVVEEEEVEALVVVMSAVVLVIWLVIVTGEEAVVAVGGLVEVVASATSAVKVVTLQGSVLLLDYFLFNKQ